MNLKAYTISENNRVYFKREISNSHTHMFPFRDSDLSAPFFRWAKSTQIPHHVCPTGMAVEFMNEGDALLAYMSFQ